MNMENKLLKIEHEDLGVWYFTSAGSCAKVLGIQQTTLNHHLKRNGNYKDWKFEWIDGSEIQYKYINPRNLTLYTK